MVNLLQVECFEAVVRTGSFRGAGTEMFLSQPSVSSHIGKLERELGLSLFERRHDGTHLTAEGERMLPHLRAFVASAATIRRASADITTNTKQSLTVYAYRFGLGQVLPTAFRTLRESFDPMQVRLVEAPRDAMIAALSDGTCDLALNTEIRNDADVIPGIDKTELIDGGPILLVGRRDHPLLDRDDWFDLADLGDEPIIVGGRIEHLVTPLLSETVRQRLMVAPDGDRALAQLDKGVADLAIIGFSTRLTWDTSIVWRPVRDAPRTHIVVMTAAEPAPSPPTVALRDYLIAWGQHQQTLLVADPDRGVRLVRRDDG